MLAAIPQDIPLREHSHLDFQRSNEGSHTDALALEEKLCPGCKKSVVSEQGGLVVAFGQSFFHVDCFKCAKCRNQVTADTNLLLLSDGSPICANCSYSCNICHLPILDEAIMTGDDSYHAHCFKCKVCDNRIDELVFAKTSQGIYCMNCHNERMIRIRKHAQKKAEREKANGGSGSSRSREQEARNYHRDQERHGVDELGRTNMRSPQPLASSRSETSRTSEHPSIFKPPNLTLPSSEVAHSPKSNAVNTRTRISRSPSIEFPHIPSQRNVPSERIRGDAVLPYMKGVGPNHAPVRPPNISQREDSLLAQSEHSTSIGGLSVPPQRGKRHSIDPGLSPSPYRDFPPNNPSNVPIRQGSLPTHTGSSSKQTPPLLSSSNHPSKMPSRSNSLHETISSQYSDQQQQSHSSFVQSHDIQDVEDTIIMSPPSVKTLDSVNQDPPQMTKPDLPDVSKPDVSNVQRSSATLSPENTLEPHPQRRLSSDSNRSADSALNIFRGASPYRVDVPWNVESGTDTESDNENEYTISQSQENHTLPPALPPKDVNRSSANNLVLASGNKTDFNSDSVNLLDVSEDVTESPSMERMSHTTFIAPALPPIRFSMNADLSDLLSSVGGLHSLKSIDTLAKLTKRPQDSPPTPPPTALSFISNKQDNEGVNSSDNADQTESSEGSDAVTINAGFVSSEDYSIEQSDNSETIVLKFTDTKSKTIMSSVQQSITRLDPMDALRKTLASVRETNARYLHVEVGFVSALMDMMDARNAEFDRLKNKVEGMNRESKLFIDGLTVAQEEYDHELKARRDAEAEVTRLRVLLSGQAVRLTALSSDDRRHAVRQQLSEELNGILNGLEQDLSRLKVERDITLAEVEELSAKRSVVNPSDLTPVNLGRSLTKRLDGIRNQYQRELVPLKEQKEILNREITELKAVRDVFLEETTVLNARNDELVQLSAIYARRMENVPEPHSKVTLEVPSISIDAGRSPLPNGEDNIEPRLMKSYKSENELNNTPARTKFKWPGSKPKELVTPSSIEVSKGKAHIEHNFQQLSILRFTRCDHCGDKMWGSQLRCTVCSTSIHVRCIANIQIPCTQQQDHSRDESVPLPPSMFGRDLQEQVLADSKTSDSDREVPIIVEKCIEAVEARALDYEGIYRKTGGSGQTKYITQLFERGDYFCFDLRDEERFNDICSITSVLKTYFRSLPTPLLTFDLHDQFTTAIAIKDGASKFRSLCDLIHELPAEHYCTLRILMLHLNRVLQKSEANLMNARNLGVVFGPTLMRSRDPGAEFSDMAGKALFIEWLVENAPQVFEETD